MLAGGVRGFFFQRLVATLATLLVMSLVIFVAERASGDPRTHLLGETATQADYNELGRRLGLDQPLAIQYVLFLQQLAVGDFGTSISQHRGTLDLVLERAPATMVLATFAFLFAVVIGVGLGILTAVKRGTVVDQLVQVIALTGQAMPAFWLGIMLILVFAVNLRWLPPSGQREWNSFLLPGITLGWYFVAANLRLVRSSMLDSLNTEYIKMARAKGLRWHTVIFKHALRNALIAPLTFAGVMLGNLITGSLVVETVFAWPGLGQLALQAVFASDYPLLQGIVIVFTVLYIGAALIVDVLYAYLDPRVRFA
jgi:peptide/nickel transport system permease protein